MRVVVGGGTAGLARSDADAEGAASRAIVRTIREFCTTHGRSSARQ
jgi:hypothetical protein